MGWVPARTESDSEVATNDAESITSPESAERIADIIRGGLAAAWPQALVAWAGLAALPRSRLVPIRPSRRDSGATRRREKANYPKGLWLPRQVTHKHVRQ